jgi:hypothetical protein
MLNRTKYSWKLSRNKVLKSIFGLTQDKVIGGWRKIQNEKLHILYSTPSITRIKSRNTMRDMTNEYKILVGKHEARDQLEDLSIQERITLNNLSLPLPPLNHITW